MGELIEIKCINDENYGFLYFVFVKRDRVDSFF